MTRISTARGLSAGQEKQLKQQNKAPESLTDMHLMLFSQMGL
jgi:hypothetical protein